MLGTICIKGRMTTKRPIFKKMKRYFNFSHGFKVCFRKALFYSKKIISVEQRETKRLAKRAADIHKVDAALDNFTTLNQALKAWPALTKLVSQDKISKVHEKQQRKRKEQQQRSKIEPIEQGLNQTILTAALLGDD